MHVRILDLDGSVSAQTNLVRHTRAFVRPARDWGPLIRLGCLTSRFNAFERDLADRFGCADDSDPACTFIGSGDFHHVSLALLRRLTQPFNLLVLDKHPDWMRRIPLMHCGTWLNHAARLPLARRVFHVGGDLDFDNPWRWLAPWDLLASKRITVLPAVRRFHRGRWIGVAHQSLRPDLDCNVTRDRLEELLTPYRDDLANYPLYISVDKDVLQVADGVVNWDSGHLELSEATAVLEAFCAAAGHNLAGMDLVGDWSPVTVQGLFRRMLHWTEHPVLNVDADHACYRNEQTNLQLLAAAGIIQSVRTPVRMPSMLRAA
jgi:hypothetical protein